MTKPDLQPLSGNASEHVELARRICGSRQFAKAARLRDFLTWVVDKQASGRAADIDEATIAFEVFGKSGDFAPLEDSAVRGAARQLRLKLHEYFETDGRDEPIILEIPKGSYIPVFRARETLSPELPSPGLPAPVVTREPRRWGPIFLVANLLLLAAHGVFAWYRTPAQAPVQETVFSWFLTHSRGPLQIVVSDFSTATLRFMSSTRAAGHELDDYAAWSYDKLAPEASADTRLQRVYELLRTHRLTRFGDLTISSMLIRAAAPGREVVARHARDVSTRELKNGAFVLLGNPNSTPWTALFEDQLGFRWVNGKGYEDVRDGGRPYFVTDSTFNEKGTGYARVALVRNLTGTDPVLLISGINMVTMEAAGEAVLRPEVWTEIRRRVPNFGGPGLPMFEALFRTSAVDNTPQKAELLVVRSVP